MGSIKDRLEQKLVSMPNGCIEFSGSRDRFGYGKLATTENRWDRTHRIAWRLIHGDIPSGMCVLHTCDNPSCVNTDHLFLGSKAENNLDKAKKGRANKKLTVEQSNAIRTSTGRLLDVAISYGISTAMVSMIRNLKVRNQK